MEQQKLKQMTKRNTQVIAETLINKMFEIAGHQVTFQDIKDRKDDWYQQWTMTESQNQEWIEWGMEYLRKQLKINKKLAEREMGWINLNWGLKTRQDDSTAVN
jgi:hypothetical protein